MDLLSHKILLQKINWYYINRLDIHPDYIGDIISLDWIQFFFFFNIIVLFLGYNAGYGAVTPTFIRFFINSSRELFRILVPLTAIVWISFTWFTGNTGLIGFKVLPKPCGTYNHWDDWHLKNSSFSSREIHETLIFGPFLSVLFRPPLETLPSKVAVLFHILSSLIVTFSR